MIWKRKSILYVENSLNFEEEYEPITFQSTIMVLTATKTTAFFTDPAQMGLEVRTRAKWKILLSSPMRSLGIKSTTTAGVLPRSLSKKHKGSPSESFTPSKSTLNNNKF
jgi:hypothetical protein